MNKTKYNGTTMLFINQKLGTKILYLRQLFIQYEKFKGDDEHIFLLIT